MRYRTDDSITGTCGGHWNNIQIEINKNTNKTNIHNQMIVIHLFSSSCSLDMNCFHTWVVYVWRYHYHGIHLCLPITHSHLDTIINYDSDDRTLSIVSWKCHDNNIIPSIVFGLTAVLVFDIWIPLKIVCNAMWLYVKFWSS